ncbi:hypothetical protein D8B46_09995 [Candidatus Gracilibacteria bacterium]|nr:MAG: hypothetical protein D8B46_09995 [Candidatus Gracilibacteria bacterium]
MKKDYTKTNLKIQNVLVKIQEGTNEVFGVNKEQFKELQIYENQYFMKDKGEIGILEISKNIKVIPGIKYIRIYF